jgi:hypothetical protein
MSFGNDPRKTDPRTPTDAQRAIAAVAEARGELLFDGPAPSKGRILRAMGRNPDGSPIGDDPDPPHKAGEIARRIQRQREGSHE